MGTLGVAMMVRNEAKVLKRALHSTLDMVSEIVVLDTGSKDDTVEIAQGFTKNVFHQSWADNFSLHRNKSFSYIKNSDWILQIDADEELIFDTPETPGIFLKWLEKLPKTVNAVSFLMKDWRESKDAWVAEFDCVRVFRRGCVNYKRRVHNDPVYIGDAAIFPLIKFKHYGYDMTEEQKAEKAKRTIGLLLLSLEDDPEDYESYFYLVQAYGAWTKENDKAYAAAEEYVKHKDALGRRFNSTIFYTVASLYLAQKDLKNAEAWILRGIQNDPRHPNLDVCWAMINLGIRKKNPDMIAQGARGFVMAYEDFEQTRLRNPGQFFFNRDVDHYAMALYYKSMSFIEFGTMELQKLKTILKSCPPTVQNEIELKIANDLKTLGLEDLNEKKLIIAPGHNPNPLLQKTGRTGQVQRNTIKTKLS